MLKTILLCLGTALSFSAFAFDLQGHRGARGLAPENTLPAFERALEIGVTTLELDIGVTADGVVVIHHDPYLNPAIARDAGGQWLAGSKGPLIKTLTLAQLQAYDVGRINPETPYARTFDAQQAATARASPRWHRCSTASRRWAPTRCASTSKPRSTPAQPDDTVSAEAMTRALLKVIEDAGMTKRVTIQSFDWRSLQLVQRIAPAIPTVCLTVQTANNDNVQGGAWTAGLKIADHGSVPKLVKAAGGAVWSPNSSALTEALLKEAQALGLKVIPWTINNPADMERLIAWGVDGIITDYPDRLRGVMQARGLPLPKPVARP